MRIFFNTLFLILFTIQLTVAQEGPSIHQLEYERHKALKLNKSNVQSNAKIRPLNKSIKNDLSKTVFGYYPDWEYQNNAHQNFRYDLLTHIGAFDFQVSAGGQISEPWGWPWTNVINEAHDNGVKVIMVLVNFDADDINTLLTSSLSRWVFMSGVQSKIKSYGLDGVNVDFEGLHTADRGELINEFMQELSDSVHSIDPELEVSFAAPAVNWGGWDLNGLANSCDYLFIMGYAFYGSWSSNTGPTAPLVSNSTLNITNTVVSEYGTISSFFPEKLILGVPYYGPHWTTTSSSEGSTTIDFIGPTFFRQAQAEADNYGLNWSSVFQNSWYNYLSGSTNHQVWYDNDSSLGLKYDLAIQKRLKGVGMWALGYDGARDELWNLIDEKFALPVIVKEEEHIPTRFRLLQNYPNPFNPTTTISYTIPSNNNSGSHVVLKIYNHLGSEINTLVNIFQPAGIYNVSFNAEHLPSGVYYYTIKTHSFIETKKMLLIK